jgi:hypothetical protein
VENAPGKDRRMCGLARGRGRNGMKTSERRKNTEGNPGIRERIDVGVSE